LFVIKEINIKCKSFVVIHKVQNEFEGIYVLHPTVLGLEMIIHTFLGVYIYSGYVCVFKRAQEEPIIIRMVMNLV